MALIQVLRYYGYNNILGTASPQHWDVLKEMGARELFDYRDPDIMSKGESKTPSLLSRSLFTPSLPEFGTP